MTPIQRELLIGNLVHRLAGAGFRNIRSRGRAHDAPLPLHGTDPPIVPDVTTRSGTGQLDVYLVVSAEELNAEEHTRRVRLAVEAAEHEARLWVAVPEGERAQARERLDALGVHARLLQV